MILYPAIDIKNGKCVRLIQGREEALKEYASDPVQMALHWENEGAAWLHVVDLDAAISESETNRAIVERLLRAVRIPVQLGGGLRSLPQIEKAVAWGASRVVLGTAAVENKEMMKNAVEQFGDYLAVGIDVKDAQVATRGWKSESQETAAHLARRLALHGVRTFVVTDVKQDGTLAGPNFALTEQIAAATRAAVILSGGIGSLEDLSKARALEARGVEGVIVGKALYEKRFSLGDALALCSERFQPSRKQ